MYQTILVPLDLNHDRVIDSVFAAARRVAAPDTARIVLLTVIPEIDVGGFPYIQTQYLKQLGDKARAQLEAIARDQVGDKHDWEIDVRIGPVAKTIISRADHFDADLIVLASHNPAFWDMLLGSVATQVVKSAHRSVLIVRQPEHAAPAGETGEISREV